MAPSRAAFAVVWRPAASAATPVPSAPSSAPSPLACDKLARSEGRPTPAQYLDRHAAQCSRAYLSSRSSRDRLIRCVRGNRQRTIARQPPPLHPRIYISIRSKSPFSPEAERELPGKEMVWNNGLTTATVPRDCPNGFVTTQLPYNINATSASWLRLIGMLTEADKLFL